MFAYRIVDPNTLDVAGHMPPVERYTSRAYKSAKRVARYAKLKLAAFPSRCYAQVMHDEHGEWRGHWIGDTPTIVR